VDDGHKYQQTSLGGIRQTSCEILKINLQI